jgi:UDP-N-acetylglucosamine--N-acetylmuramyl-(pentapeptide) pyrophosphoryl-undecaprenol N-acetylglucosamine transferase
MVSEQNAGVGLANRIASRWATRVFTSFPKTEGLKKGEWVGNPVRASIANFDRNELRGEALQHYGLRDDVPTVGVFGGSLGAASINAAVADMVAEWDLGDLQVLHLVGVTHTESMGELVAADGVNWARVGFEDRMELFFAASDLIIARAGGAVAEITATGSPSLLIPGDFGSAGHQDANARYLADAGAAEIIQQSKISSLKEAVERLLGDARRLVAMQEASFAMARPDAAKRIARAMIEAAS